MSDFLNELYRSRAEKAGIVYVDVWDGFVDEAGKFHAARTRLPGADSPIAHQRWRPLH